MNIESFMSSEEECLEHLRRIRWPQGVRCVFYCSKAVVRTEMHGKLFKAQRYDGNGVHINTIEAELSVLHPWMTTYRGVSNERLHLYCAHYQFLQDNRKLGYVERNLKMLEILRLPIHTRILSTYNPIPIDMISYERNMSVQVMLMSTCS